MTVLFWFPGLWIACAAIATAIIVAFRTERYETRDRQRAMKGRA